ncbi:AAA family ATPase [uncultured Brachyspira sp.]|uniref:AAA family ATPase n=1 Tax=uncultured Brachyspira sp. TaxID=221953 RepID=UPI0025F2DDC8|nr:AAA family ATPase [uncultured Brachyspira sp.]
MLVSFSAKNYKSFYDEVALDMRIEVNDSNREEIENNPFVYKINDDYISKLCILYGHNGSGKSNLLNAISYLTNINIYHDAPINYKYLFLPNMIYGKDENTEFILEFYYKNNLYHYKIILDNKNKKIEYELLKENENIVFERNNSNIINGNNFFINIKGIPNQITVISYCYIVDDYRKEINYYIDAFVNNFFSYMFTNFSDALFIDIDNIYSLLKNSGLWNIYRKLISLADVGIDDIKVIENTDYKENNGYISNYLRKNKYRLISIHKDYEDDFRKIESDGTKNYAINLFSMLGSLRNGILSVLDEFQGVQSELLELVISLFQKNMFEDLNNPTSQLILSTHDTNLMCLKNTLLNHYWFLNKEDNKSELYCASDFEDLKREDLEKEYKRNSLKAKYNSRLFEIPSKFFIKDNENNEQ